MKYCMTVLFLIFSLTSFCQNDTLGELELAKVFDEINKSDQSNMRNKEVRDQMFLENFRKIIKIIENQGFPNFPDIKSNKKLRASISQGSTRSFIHILQSEPQVLLNAEVIMLLGKEISAGRLNSEILKIALQVFQSETDMDRNNVWTEELRNYFYLAIREWDIKLYESSKKS